MCEAHGAYLGQIDHLLLELRPPAAFRGSPHRALRRARALYAADPHAVRRALESSRNPFRPPERAALLSALRPPPEAPRGDRSFAAFAHAASRGRYLPTAPLQRLLPRAGDLTPAERLTVSLMVPTADPGAIIRVSTRAYVCPPSRPEEPCVVLHRDAAPHAYGLPVLLGVARYLLKWCSSHPEMPPALRLTPLPPPSPLAAQLSAALARSAAALPPAAPEAFYARELLPAAAEHLTQLQGLIGTRYAPPPAEPEDSARESSAGTDAEPCAICLSPMDGTPPSRIIPCGHTFHSGCIARAAAAGDRRCPLCRAPY